MRSTAPCRTSSNEIENGSRRDQVSVNYSIDAVPELKAGYLTDVSAHDSRYVKIIKHNRSA